MKWSHRSVDKFTAVQSRLCSLSISLMQVYFKFNILDSLLYVIQALPVPLFFYHSFHYCPDRLLSALTYVLLALFFYFVYFSYTFPTFQTTSIFIILTLQLSRSILLRHNCASFVFFLYFFRVSQSFHNIILLSGFTAVQCNTPNVCLS